MNDKHDSLTVYPMREYGQREMLHGVGEDDAAAALKVVAAGHADQIESTGEEWVARVGRTVYAAMRSKRTGKMVLYAWPKPDRPQAEQQYATIVEGWNLGGFYT